jgi:hypothetical protein
LSFLNEVSTEASYSLIAFLASLPADAANTPAVL